MQDEKEFTSNGLSIDQKVEAIAGEGRAKKLANLGARHNPKPREIIRISRKHQARNRSPYYRGQGARERNRRLRQMNSLSKKGE